MITIMFALMLTTVSAAATMQVDSNTLNIVKKNPTDWSINPGAIGQITFTYQKQAGLWNPKIVSQTARATVYGLEPRTSYTLIYYGNSLVNDVWPYVTCITSGKTSSQGYSRMMSGKINYLDFLDDGIAQKFWVVKSSDVDCATGQMIAWNPSEYLFETATL